MPRPDQETTRPSAGSCMPTRAACAPPGRTPRALDSRGAGLPDPDHRPIHRRQARGSRCRSASLRCPAEASGEGRPATRSPQSSSTPWSCRTRCSGLPYADPPAGGDQRLFQGDAGPPRRAAVRRPARAGPPARLSARRRRPRPPPAAPAPRARGPAGSSTSRVRAASVSRCEASSPSRFSRYSASDRSVKAPVAVAMSASVIDPSVVDEPDEPEQQVVVPDRHADPRQQVQLGARAGSASARGP